MFLKSKRGYLKDELKLISLKVPQGNYAEKLTLETAMGNLANKPIFEGFSFFEINQN